MERARTWTVEINITEHRDERRIYADVLPGEGEARPRLSGREVPEIGDEEAAARSLADLAYKALDVATGDMEQFTHRPMRILS